PEAQMLPVWCRAYSFRSWTLDARLVDLSGLQYPLGRRRVRLDVTCCDRVLAASAVYGKELNYFPAEWREPRLPHLSDRPHHFQSDPLPPTFRNPTGIFWAPDKARAPGRGPGEWFP